jgi:hypothetical protein
LVERVVSVVVVMGPGTVVCSDVVVVLVVVGDDAQPESDTRAATTMHWSVSFFMSMFVDWVVT